MEQVEIEHIASVENEARFLEENLQLVDNQIAELDEFMKSLDFIMKSKDREMLSPIGKRVYVKTSIEDKEKLFVEVGAGVIVKKSPSETLEIIKEQISRLREARMQIAIQLEEYRRELEDFVRTIRLKD